MASQRGYRGEPIILCQRIPAFRRSVFWAALWVLSASTACRVSLMERPLPFLVVVKTGPLFAICCNAKRAGFLRPSWQFDLVKGDGQPSVVYSRLWGFTVHPPSWAMLVTRGPTSCRATRQPYPGPA